MTFFHLFTLSLIQGITEFLPISSSAHLILVPFFTDWQDQGLAMDVAVHFGTLLAVLLYFHKEILQLFTGFFALCRGKVIQETKLLFALIIATIPVIIAGFILHKMGTDFLRDIKIIAWTTLIFGIFLGITDKYFPQKFDLKDITLKTAFYIGLSQMLALIPGVSRSGITMTAARALGFTRITAARFSLLISIPTILGASLLETLDLIELNNVDVTISILWAVGLSFISSLLAIALLIKWLQRHNFMPFVYYRVFLGIFLLIYAYNLI